MKFFDYLHYRRPEPLHCRGFDRLVRSGGLCPLLTRVGARGSYKANATQIGIGVAKQRACHTACGSAWRFEKLRSRQARHAQSVEVADSKHSLGRPSLLRHQQRHWPPPVSEVSGILCAEVG
jgi:hypothetical protein